MGYMNTIAPMLRLELEACLDKGSCLRTKKKTCDVQRRKPNSYFLNKLDCIVHGPVVETWGIHQYNMAVGQTAREFDSVWGQSIGTSCAPVANSGGLVGACFQEDVVDKLKTGSLSIVWCQWLQPREMFSAQHFCQRRWALQHCSVRQKGILRHQSLRSTYRMAISPFSTFSSNRSPSFGRNPEACSVRRPCILSRGVRQGDGRSMKPS